MFKTFGVYSFAGGKHRSVWLWPIL